MEPLTRCSEVRVETLPGTAKSMTTCLALEYPEHWSRDVLDGGTFGEDLTGRLKRHLKAYGAGLQLIRRVGRAGRIGCGKLYGFQDLPWLAWRARRGGCVAVCWPCACWGLFSCPAAL